MDNCLAFNKKVTVGNRLRLISHYCPSCKFSSQDSADHMLTLLSLANFGITRPAAKAAGIKSRANEIRGHLRLEILTDVMTLSTESRTINVWTSIPLRRVGPPCHELRANPLCFRPAACIHARSPQTTMPWLEGAALPPNTPLPRMEPEYPGSMARTIHNEQLQSTPRITCYQPITLIDGDICHAKTLSFPIISAKASTQRWDGVGADIWEISRLPVTRMIMTYPDT